MSERRAWRRDWGMTASMLFTGLAPIGVAMVAIMFTLHRRDALGVEPLLWALVAVSVVVLVVVGLFWVRTTGRLRAIRLAHPQATVMLAGVVGASVPAGPIGGRTTRSAKGAAVHAIVIDRDVVALCVLAPVALVKRLPRHGLSLREVRVSGGALRDRLTLEMSNGGETIHVALHADPPWRLGQRAARESHDRAIRGLGHDPATVTAVVAPIA